MDDTVIIYPISGTVIAIIVLTPIFMFLGAAYQILSFIERNLPIIITVMTVISCILVVIPFIKIFFKKFENTAFLHLLGSAVSTSQLILFLRVGFKNILTMDMGGFGLTWTIIVFTCWLLYSAVNTVATYFLMFGSTIGFFSDEADGLTLVLCILGVVGWFVNLVVFVVF